MKNLRGFKKNYFTFASMIAYSVMHSLITEELSYRNAKEQCNFYEKLEEEFYLDKQANDEVVLLLISKYHSFFMLFPHLSIFLILTINHHRILLNTQGCRYAY